MKHTFISLLLLLMLSLQAFAQMWSSQRLDSDFAKISFSTDTLNYGAVKFKGNGYREIKFVNTGKCPLIVWSTNSLNVNEAVLGKKKLFLPGDTGLIKIFHPTDVPGAFSRTLCIYSNAEREKQIIIKGIILPEELCADMQFANNEIDLGPIHYVYGNHFTIKVPSTGKCPLNFTVAPGDEYLNVLNYSTQTVSPGDSGIIEIHLGGQVVGNYYGTLDIYSSNSKTKSKSVLLKATFMPPDGPDTLHTDIVAVQDLIDVGTIAQKQITVTYTVKNTGKKPLVFKPVDTDNDIIKLPLKPITQGKTESITVTYSLNNIVGAFMKHINLSGNFKGTCLPLYVKGYNKPN